MEDAVCAVAAVAVAKPVALVSVGEVVRDQAVFVVQHELGSHLAQFQGAPVIDDVVRVLPVLLGGEHRQEPAEPSRRNARTVMNFATY